MATLNQSQQSVHLSIPFTKMHGCGNDYIYLNCFDTVIDNPEELAPLLSDRHFGIGGDGIVLMLPSKEADARMRMFNQDGSEGSMCGNAIRCVAKYLQDNKIVSGSPMRIETPSGIKTIETFYENGVVTSARVDMGAPLLNPPSIPVDMPGEHIVAVPLLVGDTEYEITCLSMGNPHAVVFCEEIAALDLSEIGPLFEHHVLFPDRINTEFVKVIDEHTLEMRVWERGAGETMACGTGACAAAVAATLNGYCELNTEVTIRLLGGELVIQVTPLTVCMTGECVKVFEGTIDVVFDTRTKNQED